MACLWFSCVGRSREEESTIDPNVIAISEEWKNHYIEGDEDETAVTSLIKSEQGEKIRHALAIALPRERWADIIVKNTPRSSKQVSLESLSPHDPSSPKDPFLSNRRTSTSSPLSSNISDEPESNIETMSDSLKRKVARNFMTFQLGVHPEFPDKTVGESIINDIVIEAEEVRNCYANVLLQVYVWAERRLLDKKNRRTSASGVVYINADAPELSIEERRRSPKMFLDDTDDELRTFIGGTQSGVPLIRLIAMRVAENSIRTNSVTVHGIIIVNIDFAKQIQSVKGIYANWMIEEIVKRLGKIYDFIRLSKEFATQNAEVILDLLRKRIIRNIDGRYIFYAKEAGMFSFSGFMSRESSFIT